MNFKKIEYKQNFTNTSGLYNRIMFVMAAPRSFALFMKIWGNVKDCVARSFSKFRHDWYSICPCFSNSLDEESYEFTARVLRNYNPLCPFFPISLLATVSTHSEAIILWLPLIFGLPLIGGYLKLTQTYIV